MTPKNKSQREKLTNMTNAKPESEGDLNVVES